MKVTFRCLQQNNNAFLEEVEAEKNVDIHLIEYNLFSKIKKK